jgi:hypothetical protein
MDVRVPAFKIIVLAEIMESNMCTIGHIQRSKVGYVVTKVGLRKFLAKI